MRDVRRRVEHQREVGREAGMRDFRERANRCGVDAPAAALVRLGRVRESIAEHAAPGGQCRPDDLRDMARARREIDQELGGRADRTVTGFEHQRAQFLRKRSAARLARDDRFDSAVAQVRRRQRNLRGLADAFHALECDERAAHARQRTRTLRPRRRLAMWRDTFALCAASVAAKKWRPSPSPVATK